MEDIATAFGFDIAEVEAAIATVDVPPEAGGNPQGWCRTFWDHAAAVFIDLDEGRWRHELPATDRAGTWSGKPDLYHAGQATQSPNYSLHPASRPNLPCRIVSTRNMGSTTLEVANHGRATTVAIPRDPGTGRS